MADADNRPRLTLADVEAMDQDEVLRGYLDGLRGTPPPRLTTDAYDHGRRNAVNDRAGEADEEQRALAREWSDRERRRRQLARNAVLNQWWRQ